MNRYEPDAAQVKTLVAGFATRAAEMEAASSLAWRMRTDQGATVLVSLEEGWFRLQSPLPDRRRQVLPGPRRSQRLLGSNSMLPGGMSYCVGPRNRRTYLVADYELGALEGDSDEAIALFDRFCNVLDRSPRELAASCGPVPPQLCQPLTVDDQPGEAARDLCTATGWEFHERGSGQLAITLDTNGHFCQAFAFSAGDDDFRLASTLETTGTPSPRSRHAMDTFLLTATQIVRMARAAIVVDASLREYRWEVVWSGVPSAAAFHCGLSALSMACRMTVREMQALCDESIANSYLEMRGRSSQ